MYLLTVLGKEIEGKRGSHCILELEVDRKNCRRREQEENRGDNYEEGRTNRWEVMVVGMG